ncbi:indoleamine 2,3-dioxygenase 2 isoform X9 [Oncorhynchus tshawytscha]|uniref:indoleamine 2,3-dioxygenase 2 isoform X9 n=1 Tax=Oncorhynchus tshawytscha TaxID=74940 RepID=UPI001C3DEA22|nr:indoleamine 2,3-dioxygenase 2 isoform X9 [Oncorhynchus tshawytscha]
MCPPCYSNHCNVLYIPLDEAAALLFSSPPMATTITDSQKPFSLDPYHVSEEFGFILPAPLAELPPYYQPWMDIAQHVTELIYSHMLRSHILKMPLLNTQLLESHRELRLAHLALSVMTMGYVWQEGEDDTVKMLPRNLAIPYCEVSQRLGLPPILTHADAVLANWRKRDPQGWKDNSSMPAGLVYEGVQAEPMEYSGGSAAQSSLLHCFDELLGVKHEAMSGILKMSFPVRVNVLSTCTGAFLTRMRNYMPPSHKRLIQDISLQPSLRGFVQQQACEPLTAAFQLCVTKLLALRSYHINVVSRFIIVPAARARQLRNQGNISQEETVSRAPTALEEKGTGGSGIMSFLKTVRDRTRDVFNLK